MTCLLGFASEPVDSISVAPQQADSVPAGPKKRIIRDKVDLDNTVNFTSSDSMIVIGRNHSYMYGNSKVTYGDLQLTAENIDLDLKTSNVNASGVTDSLGVKKGTPNFSQGGESYDSESMSYNFKTERGYITNVITQQGEGYLTGGQAKRIENGEFYIKDGRYTTCDDHEHPHFHLQITKGKVKPGSNIVTGPAYMVLAGLPLPIAVPFGYFPFTKKYSSGIIFPTVGDDYRRGFYLSNGGYYFAINDNVDLALTGQLYTKGTWGINARSAYVKRYKYAGNVSVSYLRTVDGEKGSPDYSKATNFQVIWNHQQDSKFNPNMTFSASVNFATSGYSRKDVASYYSNNFTENTKSSTVNMTYRFPGTKWSLSTSMNITQRSSDEMLNVSFPNLTVTMAQTAPFKRKRPVGAEKWYEKIKLSYSGQLQNSLTAKQNEFFKKSIVKDWKNGLRHSVPISATFQLLKYINITPSVQLTDRMYFQKVRRQWDPNAAAEVADTTYNFYNVFDFSASIGVSTKLYGFWQPLGIFGKKIKMIRHVMTPTISLSGAPDFGTPFWGYYGEYQYTDNNGQLQRRQYSYFQNGPYGSASTGKQGTVNFSLSNNLEMKVKSDNDSTGERKISLIENLSLSQSYNFAADSLNWSNLNTSILLRITKGFNLNLSAVWDVYTYKLNQYGTPYRSNTLRLTSGKGWGRLSSTGTSFSYNFNNDTFKKLFGRKRKSDDSSSSDGSDKKSDKKKTSAGEFDPDGYLHWQFPWNLNVSYSVSYGYGKFNKKKMEYDGKWTQNLSFSGSINPTPNWNFSFSASYNFDLKKIAYMNCNISRDLHCFTMTASFVPLGPYKSYNFHIAVKSSLLSDLKYDKRSSYNDAIDWY
ncbi:MAG: LPS-assembly protein LptD [Bacteroides sp.]|nr:LPS-assembly protein LptD [Bacteroides sp.]